MILYLQIIGEQWIAIVGHHNTGEVTAHPGHVSDYVVLESYLESDRALDLGFNQDLIQALIQGLN